MLSVSRRPQQINEKIKVRNHQEKEKSKTEPEEAKRYAYLSIDPKTQMITNSHKINSTIQSNQFLNVKFDTKKEMRQTYLLKFKEEMALKGIRFSDPSLSEKTYEQTKSYAQSHSKTKKVKKGEQLRRSCERILEQRQQKILSVYDKTAVDTQSFKEKEQISTLLIPDSIKLAQKDEKNGKSRKNIFHKMLKKCDKLKEIYRYQNELICMIEVKKECSIKFHTEPFLISSNSNPFDFPKRKLSNIGKLNKAKTFDNQNHQEKIINAESDSLEDINTLDVRKYNNVSSVKKRMKFFKRQKLLKQQHYRIESKTTQKKQYRAVQRFKDKQQVGPWQYQAPIS